jgi:hypothetical protein
MTTRSNISFDIRTISWVFSLETMCLQLLLEIWSLCRPGRNVQPLFTLVHTPIRRAKDFHIELVDVGHFLLLRVAATVLCYTVGVMYGNGMVLKRLTCIVYFRHKLIF